MVTRHVMALEKQLGARLMNRTTRRVDLTAIGSVYFEHCAAMLRDLENAQENVRELQKKPEGALRIVAPRSFGTLFLSDAVSQFALQYPHIRVTLILNDTAANASNFTADNFDVAIRLSALSENSVAIARKIGALEWVVCAAPGYLATVTEIKTPADLSRVNCLLQTTSPADATWHFGVGRKGESIRVSGTFRSNSVLALKAAALAGLGVAQLPRCYIDDELANGQLKQIAIQPPLGERPVCILLPDNRRIPRSTQMFVNFIAQWYKKKLWAAS
jgi:DNA-binding transcriptional LysR family regulator